MLDARFHEGPSSNASRTKETFVFAIPLVAKSTAPCWESVTLNLVNTLCSVIHQQQPNHLVLLCGHDMPQLPPEVHANLNLEFLEAGFPLPHAFGQEGMKDRKRKLQQIGIWLRENMQESFKCMFLDADDWLCEGLCEEVLGCNSDSWAIRKGYKYDLRNDIAVLHGSDMIKSCGSTFIFRAAPEFFPVDMLDTNNLWNKLYSPHSLRPHVMIDHGKSVIDLVAPLVVYLVNHDNSHWLASEAGKGKSRALIKVAEEKRISPSELRKICGIPADS